MNDLWKKRIDYWTLLIFFLFFAFESAYFNVSDVDVGFHIRTGAQVVEAGAIPANNTFSHAQPGHPWLLHQWLPGICFYAAYTLFGLTGLVVFKSILVSVIFLIVIISSRRLVQDRWGCVPFIAATIGILVARTRFFERPYMFSAMMLALLVLLNDVYSGRKRWNYAGLPLLMAIWANMYAGVMDGFVYLLILVFVDASRRIIAERVFCSWLHIREISGFICRSLLPPAVSAIVAMISVWIINPNGYTVILYPLNFFFDPFWKDQIMEYHPPDGIYFNMLLAYVCVLVLLQLLSWRRIRFNLAVPCLVFGWLAFQSQRCVLMFVIVATPYMAALFDEISSLKHPFVARGCVLGMLPAWAFLVLFIFLPGHTFKYGADFYPRYYPTGIYTFLRDKVPQQNLYNNMMYGGSMLWFLYPQFRPFIDGRCEAYSVDFWKTCMSVDMGQSCWRDIFKKYDVHGALIPLSAGKGSDSLCGQLHADPGWALVCFDDYAMLFLERSDLNSVVIEENEHHLLSPDDIAASLQNCTNALEMVREACRVLQHTPGSSVARTFLAIGYMRAFDFKAAASVYAGLVAEEGAGATYWRDYSYCLLMAGESDKSEQVARTMIERNYDPGAANYMLYLSALKKNDSAAARRFIRQAVEENPDEKIYRTAMETFDK